MTRLRGVFASQDSEESKAHVAVPVFRTLDDRSKLDLQPDHGKMPARGTPIAGAQQGLLILGALRGSCRTFDRRSIPSWFLRATGSWR